VRRDGGGPMTDDTVTATLAEWEADMGRRVPAADPEDRNIARALLGFAREVREGHEAEAEARAFDPLCCARCREEWPCPTEQAARKWIGGQV